MPVFLSVPFFSRGEGGVMVDYFCFVSVDFDPAALAPRLYKVKHILELLGALSNYYQVVYEGYCTEPEGSLCPISSGGGCWVLPLKGS